jgi:hypothetical protein
MLKMQPWASASVEEFPQWYCGVKRVSSLYMVCIASEKRRCGGLMTWKYIIWAARSMMKVVMVVTAISRSRDLRVRDFWKFSFSETGGNEELSSMSPAVVLPSSDELRSEIRE